MGRALRRRAVYLRVPSRGEVMTGFAEFVKNNSTECRLCKFFNEHPDVNADIDIVLSNGKPPHHFRLISNFLLKSFGETFSADYVQKHYDRHKEKA